MEEFDKIVEEVIWASFCDLYLRDIKMVTEKYKNIDLLLSSKGDLQDRSTFRDHIGFHSGTYNFNDLINETIQLLGESHWRFSLNSFAVFCIGLRNKDEKLINSACEKLKEKGKDEWFWRKFSQVPNSPGKILKIFKKVIEKLIENLKRRGN